MGYSAFFEFNSQYRLPELSVPSSCTITEDGIDLRILRFPYQTTKTIRFSLFSVGFGFHVLFSVVRHFSTERICAHFSSWSLKLYNGGSCEGDKFLRLCTVRRNYQIEVAVPIDPAPLQIYHSYLSKPIRLRRIPTNSIQVILCHYLDVSGYS